MNVAEKLTEAVSKGYPIPFFFVVEGEEYEEYKKDTSHMVHVVKKNVGNRKKLENWTDADIKQDFDFDILILCNHHGSRMFNKEYTEIYNLSKEEIESIDFGDHYY